MTNPDILAKRLLVRAHNRDGLPEILTGVLFLAISGLGYAVAVLPHRSWGSIAAILTFSLGLPAASLLLPRGIQWLRRRYLVEREGYVEHQPCRYRVQPWLIGVVAGLGVALLGAAPIPGSVLVAATGLAGGLLCAVCGQSPRFYFSGLVIAATGLTLGFAGISTAMGFLVLFGVQGVVEVCAGTIAWSRFLKETNER
jgi:hypothetical protein